MVFIDMVFKAPMMVINTKLQEAIGELRPDQLIPDGDGWCTRLQLLLKEVGVDLEIFCRCSQQFQTEEGWPTFYMEDGRLEIFAYDLKHRADIFNILELIKKTTRYKLALVPVDVEEVEWKNPTV